MDHRFPRAACEQNHFFQTFTLARSKTVDRQDQSAQTLAHALARQLTILTGGGAAAFPEIQKFRLR